MNRERAARALSAIAGGLLLALDHLRGDTPGTEPLPVVDACPECGRTLGLMHIHDDHALWRTLDPHAVLVTKLDGTDAIEIGGAL